MARTCPAWYVLELRSKTSRLWSDRPLISLNVPSVLESKMITYPAMAGESVCSEEEAFRWALRDERNRCVPGGALSVWRSIPLLYVLSAGFIACRADAFGWRVGATDDIPIRRIELGPDPAHPDPPVYGAWWPVGTPGTIHRTPFETIPFSFLPACPGGSCREEKREKREFPSVCQLVSCDR